MKGIIFLTDIKEPREMKIDQSRNIREYATQEDLKKAEEHWQKRLATNPKFFDGELGNLMDSRGERDYISSNFSIYETFALAYPNQPNPYSNLLTRTLRSSAVTCTITTKDDYVIVQKIPENLVCGNMIDPTAGGMVPARNGVINPLERIKSRLGGEPRIKWEDVIDWRYTGAHLAKDILTFTDTYAGRVNQTFGEVKEKFIKDGSDEIYGVKTKDLEGYIIENAVHENNLVDDCTGTLLASLDEESFKLAVERMHRTGANILFGYFDKALGRFVRTA